MLTWTIAWSLWEVGLDDWALQPRLIAPALIGLLFMLPAVRRATHTSRWWVGAPALAVLVIVSVAVVRAETAESDRPAAAKVTPLPGVLADWPNWGNTLAGTKYAAIDQINLGNVSRLKLAWRYDSDIKPGALPSLEAAPLAVDGRLYMCIESGTIDALDQDTGKRIWRYRALPENSPFLGWKCRGVAYYAARGQTSDCQRRLFLTTSAGQLIAIDADTGRQCSSFANGGVADLKDGMGEMKSDEALPTSPPTVVSGVIVVGQSISDFGSCNSPSGVIRGYDAETGELRWAWDIGRPGQVLLRPRDLYT
jgi:glucose dehydrogenase